MKEPSVSYRIFIFLLSVIFTCACLWIVFSFIKASRLSQESQKWPSVLGEIVESDDVFVSSGYRALIKYQYVVNGRTYTNNKISFAWAYSNNIALGGQIYNYRRLLLLFPRYKKVNIYFNPLNPQQSVLMPGTHMICGWIFIFLISIFGFIVGILGITSLFSSQEKRRMQTLR